MQTVSGNFLSLHDLTAGQVLGLLERTAELKAAPPHSNLLQQQTLMLLFEQPSTRTRLSFSVAAHQMGGHSLFITATQAQLARGEPIEDVARVAGGMVNAVAVRTASHERLTTFARNCRVPVINALSDRLHPCQTLADLMTIREEFAGSTAIGDVRVAWVGDGNNSLHSWLEASALLGFGLRYACPPGYAPDPQLAEAASRAEAVPSPADAVADAQVVSTDVWVSMNQEAEQSQRCKDFAGWQVNSPLMERAAAGAILLHCLPAHRGQEVSADILDAPCSRVWQQAENRLHTQKALLELLLT